MNTIPRAGGGTPGFFVPGIFDLHSDTITECALQNQPLRENRLHLSLERGKKFLPWAQCFAIWMPEDCRGSEAVRRFEQVYRCFQREMAANADLVLPCKTAQDLLRAEREGKCAALLTVEGGAALAGDLARVKRLADCGVRMLTLTWNGPCELGDGAMTEHPRGLTGFGRNAVAEMERHGIVVDVSHASDPLFEDVAAHTTRPLVASHSNARAVCAHPRNLTDAQFQLIRERGGLVGLNFHPPFLVPDGEARLPDILRHAEHFLSLGGEDVLALGSDFDGAGLPQGIAGIQSMEQLAEHFAHNGCSNRLIEKIFYKNARNFFVSL